MAPEEVAKTGNDPQNALTRRIHCRPPMSAKARAGRPLPTGTVTFLFTDIEGSTQLWEQSPEGMQAALAGHDESMRRAIDSSNGVIVKTTGDGVHAAFAVASDALAACLAAQRALQDAETKAGNAEPRGSPSRLPVALRVRMALHTGVAELRGGDYFGSALNRAARIMSAAHGGQILLSAATAELVRGQLPQGITLRDVGEHRLKGLVNAERLLQVVAPDLQPDFPPLRSLNAEGNNLPLQATSFIGRDTEQAEIVGLLSSHRLVTLTGAGGIGKTRLSIAVGTELLSQYSDGVWFVDLAPLSDPRLVAVATAAVFGLSLPGTGSAATAVATFLKHKKTLIILDNCEHLIAACAELADAIIRVCPDVSLLASSREALRVQGERVYPVGSLATPDQTDGITAETTLSYPAVRLFVDRAEAASGGFVLTDEMAATVAAICKRLDGVALAIELAAPRVKMLNPEQLLRGLNDQFKILTGGVRSALPRHQTLRAMLDWSYDLLSAHEKILLRRLSIFAGSWTIDAATEVAGDDAIEDKAVFDLVSSLVDKSLVSGDFTSSVPRYRLLESTRQYALEKLIETGETGCYRRHAEYLIRLFAQAEREYPTTATEVWLAVYAPELENLRAVLEWSFGPAGETSLGIELTAYTGDLWRELGLSQEARRWFPIAAAHLSDSFPAPIASRIWLNHAYMGSVGDPKFVESALRAVALARQAGEPDLRGKSLVHASYLVRPKDASSADAYLLEAEVLMRPLGRTKLLASLLNVLAEMYRQRGDIEASRAHREEAMAVAGDVGHWLGYAAARANQIDDTFHDDGNVEAAIAEMKELVDQLRQRKSLALLGLALFLFGDYLLAADRVIEARAIGLEGIRLNRSLARSAPVNACLETLALAAALAGANDRAARLAGYVKAFYEKVGFDRSPTQQNTWDRLIVTLGTRLSPSALVRLMAEGEIWSEDHAVSEATNV